jgi:hypothetical protein
MGIKKLAILALIGSGLFFSVQANEFKSADNSRYTNLCMTAVEGNLAKMHNTIKSTGYSTKYVITKVQCNGEALLSFVENNGKNASSMLKMLDRDKTSVSITDLAKVN